MLAARLHDVGDIRVADEHAPTPPTPGRSTVQITSVGLCGSDLHWFTDGGIGENRISRPVVPGHEMAGVALDGPHAGRRVAIDPAIPCQRCDQCCAGHGNLCPNVEFAGHGQLDGGLQELLVWPDHLLFPLPDSLSDDAGAMLEPLGVAIHAVGLAHLHLGDDVLIIGAGPIGLLAAQVAYRSGAARVFASETLEHRLAAARRYSHNAWTPADTAAGIADATDGHGVNAVIELAGNNAAVATAVDCARPSARIALAGIPDDDSTTFPASAARRKGLSFVMVRRMHNTYPRAIHLAVAGIDLEELVTRRFPLTDSNTAFSAAARRTALKTVVCVSAMDSASTATLANIEPLDFSSQSTPRSDQGGEASPSNVTGSIKAAITSPNTLADVAKLAGVSHQTVSRVINNSSAVRPVTRQRVLDAVAAAGYSPNDAARELAQRRRKVRP